MGGFGVPPSSSRDSPVALGPRERLKSSSTEVDLVVVARPGASSARVVAPTGARFSARARRRAERVSHQNRFASTSRRTDATSMRHASVAAESTAVCGVHSRPRAKRTDGVVGAFEERDEGGMRRRINGRRSCRRAMYERTGARVAREDVVRCIPAALPSGLRRARDVAVRGAHTGCVLRHSSTKR